VVVHSDALLDKSIHIKNVFESKFQSRFGSDPSTNRNLIKRFAESIELAALFSSPELIALVRDLSVMSPVYCGPIVSHYTHSDLTGNSYGLPWHQDFPSMASSSNAVIVWISVNACSTKTHSIEVAPGRHKQGLLPGDQMDTGYILSDQTFKDGCVLDIKVGEVLLFSPYLPHRTFVNPSSNAYKLSFSRRYDDLECPHWPKQKFANAYSASVDRMLYKKRTESV
jgi:ectoine hydroxylase-related dioxygenase (phytanoyl-CoA dioxygenase family)